MLLYDIHTHAVNQEINTVSIENYIIRSPFHFTPSPGRLYSIGIHPWFTEDRDKQLRFLSRYMSEKEIVAIGECGLDKTIDTAMDLQVSLFEAQLSLAEETGKPVIIHCVKAWDELIRMYKKRHDPTPWVIHGFRGKPELAQQLVHNGFYLSFGKKYNPDSLMVAWPEKLFIETDESRSPLKEIYAGIAGFLGITTCKLAAQVHRNAGQVFGL